jgi:high affinity Mn2+ porin
MGRFTDAVALAQANGLTADTALVRHFASRSGLNLNFEQAISSTVDIFARAGLADGRYESYEFTDVDRSISGGAAIKGLRWGRPNDTLGAAFAVNAASKQRISYLDAGGLGILTGDGRLPHPGDEHIAEIYYDTRLLKAVSLTGDFQVIGNPGYNRDRGPVIILGARFHAQF